MNTALLVAIVGGLGTVTGGWLRGYFMSKKTKAQATLIEAEARRKDADTLAQVVEIYKTIADDLQERLRCVQEELEQQRTQVGALTQENEGLRTMLREVQSKLDLLLRENAELKAQVSTAKTFAQ